MKRHHRRPASWLVIVTACACLSSAAPAQETAAVLGDRVNVRGLPSLSGEVITQVNKSESVVILEEIKLEKPKPGEPALWLKIAMPPNTPLWIHANFIDPLTKTVSATKLNVRGGPGENFSVVGVLPKGATVSEIRTEGIWMEIETPPGAYAYVAADLIDLPKKPEGAPPVPEPKPTPLTATPPPLPGVAQPPTAQPQPEPQPQPPPSPTPTTVVETPAPAAAQPVTPPPLPGAAAPLPAAEQPQLGPPSTTPTDGVPPPKRIVIRDGVVVRTFSIQAPSPFALENPENGELIDYLDAREFGVKLNNLKGLKVRVTGEEQMDKRWERVPVLVVESVSLLPE